MVFPGGSLEFMDETITPSEGRAVWVREAEGRGVFRDPDAVYRRWFPDGSSQLVERPLLRSLEAAERLGWDFGVQRLRDSLGRFVGVGALTFPEEGVWFTGLRGAQNITVPYALRPEAFQASSNAELIERVIFVNRDGTLRVQEWSFGRGQEYDPTHHGGGFLREGMAAAGIRREGSRLTAAEYAKVKAAVISVEWVVREARWR